jgi:hypothetical protein
LADISILSEPEAYLKYIRWSSQEKQLLVAIRIKQDKCQETQLLVAIRIEQDKCQETQLLVAIRIEQDKCQETQLLVAIRIVVVFPDYSILCLLNKSFT